MKPRIAFVVQRCIPDASGGAEAHCLSMARHMADCWDIEILTTTALDYVTWNNYFDPGVESVDGIPVRRFTVDRSRNKSDFDRVSAQIAAGSADVELQRRWMLEQGPHCPDLSRFIQLQRDNYDALYFFSYSYATTWDNWPHVAHKSILVPLAHDDWVLGLTLWEGLFRAVPRCLFNTPEEKQLLTRRFPDADIVGPILGVGVDRPAAIRPLDFRARFGVDDDFLLYLGRVDESKGCTDLFKLFRQSRREGAGPGKLVLIGDSVMQIPDDPDIVHLGVLSEGDKWSALAACQCLVMPSRFESLSMVLLEAWSVGRPVLVNGACSVLVGQCRRANGGLWYGDAAEFCAALDLLYCGRYADVLGRQGHEWAARTYDWGRLSGIMRGSIELLRGPCT